MRANCEARVRLTVFVPCGADHSVGEVGQTVSRAADRISRVSILFICVAVVAMSLSLPARVYHAAVRLLGTTIGVGPSFDGFGLSIPLLFNGTVLSPGDAFHTVPYPAQLNLDYPFISDLPILSDLPYWPHSLKQSERIGVGFLEQDLARTPPGAKVTVIGYSQGSQVAEIARADMAKDPAYVANADDYRFILVGNPYQPNGGILARFTSWSEVPVIGDLFPLGRPGPSDSPFRTTYYQNQYDGFADFPAYFSLLAVTNALLGIVFEHVLPGYVFDDPTDSNVVSSTVGNTTYVTIPHLLPLLEPLRLAASLIGAQRFVDALDPILRVFVERAYDRTADPSQVKEFAWTIPQEKVQAAWDALPAAFAQSLAILCGATYTPTVPVPVVASEQPETPVTEHPAQPVDDSHAAQAVRGTVVGLTNVLSAVTQSVAWLLQVITGHAPSQAVPEPAVEVAADSGPAQRAAPATAVAASPQPPKGDDDADSSGRVETASAATSDDAEPVRTGRKQVQADAEDPQPTTDPEPVTTTDAEQEPDADSASDDAETPAATAADPADDSDPETPRVQQNSTAADSADKDATAAAQPAAGAAAPSAAA